LDIDPSRCIQTKPQPAIIDRFTPVKLKYESEKFIFHSSYFRYTKNTSAYNIITMFDLIHHKFYFGPRKLVHNLQESKGVKKSDAIISISENTKKDLLHYYPYLNPADIHVIYLGASTSFFKITDSDYSYITPAEHLNKRYLLFVSSREPYKNFNFAVDVLSKLDDFELYIVGAPLTQAESEMVNAKIGRRWKVFTGISTAQLNELYNHAYSLIYPSSYEGFGIPLLEAMSTFCPFIAINASSIPEVAGDAGILLDELNVNDGITAILQIDNQREKLIIRGQKQVSKFSWDKCYNETALLYQNIFNKS